MRVQSCGLARLVLDFSSLSWLFRLPVREGLSAHQDIDSYPRTTQHVAQATKLHCCSSGGVSPGGCGSSMPRPWWYNITRPGWRDGFATLDSRAYLSHAFLGYIHVSFETLSGQDIVCQDCNMIMRFPAWSDHKKGKKHKRCKLRNRRIALAQQSCACTGCPWWIEKRLEDPDSAVATLAELLPSALVQHVISFF